MGKTKIRRIVVLAVLAAILGVAVVVLRGPHVSNFLKKLILPELSAATGKQVVAQKIFLNLFPLYVEAKEIRVLDGEKEVLHVPRLKGYLEISGLLRKKLYVRRLLVKGPDIKLDVPGAEDIMKNLKQYLQMERKTALKVVIKAVALDNGKFSLDYDKNSFKGSGFSGEAVLNAGENFITRKRQIPRIGFTIKELTSSLKGLPELKSEIKGSFTLRENALDIKALQVGFYGSMVNTTGAVSLKDDSNLHVRLGLLAQSFKKLFSLKQPGEGGVSAKGTVRVVREDLLKSAADLDLKGDFHVETLLELLKEKESVKGFVDFSGTVKGPLNRLIGTAKARLRKGSLYDVQVDELKCIVKYADKKLDFSEGKAVLYNGRAEAEAVILVGGDGFYSLKVGFSDVDSPGVLKLIGWEPEIPFGKVRGELRTSGTEFNPSGSFSYASAQEGKDFLGRIKRIKGLFAINGNVVTLSNSSLSTDKSVIDFGGTVDIDARLLSMSVLARTSDILDLTLPYTNEYAGSGEFSGTLKGLFDNPAISGRAKLGSVSYEGYGLGELTANLDYKKDLLELKDLSAVAGSQPESMSILTMKGNIRYPEGKELFDLKKPVYNLSVTMKNGDLERFTKVIFKDSLKDFPKGKFDTVVTMTGKGPEPVYRGSGRIMNASWGKAGVDSASFSYSYDYHTFAVEDALARKGDSTLSAKGSISHDDRFSVTISAGKVYVKDIVSYKELPEDAYVSFKGEAAGKLDDPSGRLDGVVHGGRLKDSDLGEGRIRASFKEKAIFVDMTVLDDRIALSGKMGVNEEMPWTAHLDLKPGRYDYLITPWMKDVPEGFLVNMRGSADMSGDKKHFGAKADVRQLSVTFYGNNLTNDSDLRFEMRDRKVVLSDVKLRSGTGTFKATGEMEIGKEYNLVLEGSSSLAPLKGLSKKIDTMRGDASFVFAVTGKWTDPRLDGGVTVTNALLGVKDVPYRFSSVNGYFYMDGDRVVIQKLSGKLGGGDAEMSGVAILQGFALKRFYVNTAVTNVGFSISKDFTASFDGSLAYTGTAQSQTISGEIRIDRSAYREPVEWQSWLLKAKAVERPRGEVGTFEKTHLNVKIQGSDNVIINNNIARASLRVDLVLRGTVGAPQLLGRITTKTGIVYFRNNEFRILNATADFADPRRINPTMDIAAETTIQGYTIRLVLEGQMDRFNMTLTSNPSLEEIEILSLLTVGTLSNEPKGIQGGIGTSAATSFLSGQLQNVAQERLRALTGIDRIGVEPYVSKVTGKSEQRLTVSKRLMGDRLSVTYATALGSTASDVIRLEYNIGNNVALIGERDEVGAFGGSVKFRFGFK